jgi:radical SAM-linked protein
VLILPIGILQPCSGCSRLSEIKLSSKTMRIRVTFSKTDHMRYTGHLDLHRTWERTLRRARLPLSYSQGFNPRPKINLAAALPLGFTSDCELVEFWLDSDQPVSEVESHLREAAPPGIEIHRVEKVDPQTPKIPNLVEAAEFQATLEEPIPDLAVRVNQLLTADTLERERRGKAYDLRPLIEDLQVEDNQHLNLRLAARANATGRPEEVLEALGVDPLATRVHRTKLIMRE